MDFINLLGAAAWPEGNFWASLIKLFDVGSYAWTIILFTVILKLVLSPLDFLQRFYTNKTTRAQAKLQPELQKLQKRYGQNQTLLAQKQNELYQKNNVSMKGSCIVMLIYMVVTLTVFMTLYSSLGTISNYKINTQFEELQATYHNSYDVEYEKEYLQDYLNISNLDDYYSADNKEEFLAEKESLKIAEFEQTLTHEEALAKFDAEKSEILLTAQQNGQDLVFKQYDEIKDSWLWVKNIWRADNPTIKQILSYTDFKNATNTSVSETEYNAVMGKLLNDPQTNSANGYYILSAIVVIVSLLSQIITRKMSQPKTKDGQVVATPGAGKIMMFIMPIIMMLFTLSSSAMFAIYIITNSLISTILTPITTVVCNKIEDKKEKTKKEKNKAEYSR